MHLADPGHRRRIVRVEIAIEKQRPMLLLLRGSMLHLVGIAEKPFCLGKPGDVRIKAVENSRQFTRQDGLDGPKRFLLLMADLEEGHSRFDIVGHARSLKAAYHSQNRNPPKINNVLI
ncbi:MAG: hypothetical protein R3D02_03550 [Hyphomicrobiales bacterium]